MQQPLARTKTRRCCHALLVAIVLLILLRNPIARFATTRIGSRLLGASVEIDNVRIGWSVVEVRGLRVREPASSDLQLTIARVTASTSPWNGFRNGIWARRVIVREPTLHLRFDRSGKLLTQFPGGAKPSHGSMVIPISELWVRHGAVSIHQEGRGSFTVDHANLDAQFGSSIRLQGDVPRLLGGVVKLRTEVDGDSLAGRSTVSVDGIMIDTKRLAQLPLMPTSIGAELVTAKVSLSSVIEHPPNELDVRRHSLKLLLSLRDLHVRRLGPIGKNLSLKARSQDGALAVKADGDLFDGVVGLDVAANLVATPMKIDLTATADGMDLARVASGLLPEISLRTIAGLQASASLSCDAEAVSFRGSLRTIASEITLERMCVADVVGEVHGSGTVSRRSKGHLAGTVEGSVRTDGVEITDVARHFKLTNGAGRIAASADFHVSLGDLLLPESYTVNALLQTTNVAVGDLSLHDTAGVLRVDRGMAFAEIKDAAVYDSQATRVATCSALAQGEIASDGLLAASIGLSLSPKLARVMLPRLASTTCDGELVLEASASCPIASIVVPDAWQAHGAAGSKKLVFAGEAIDDFEAGFDLVRGQLSIPSFSLQWQDSCCEITANGKLGERIELLGDFAARPVRISNFAQLVSRFSSVELPASGMAEVDGAFRVVTWPLEFEASGAASVKQAMCAGRVIGEAELTWQADLGGAVLRSSSDDFLGGQYDLEVTTRSLDWTKSVINGTFQGIQASRLAVSSNQRIPVSGVVDGGICLASIADLESLEGYAWVKSRGLSIHHVPLEVLTAKISLASNDIVANCEGTVSDGRYVGTAKSNLVDLLEFVDSPNRQLDHIPIVAEAKIDDLSIETLTRTLQLPKELRTLSGKITRVLLS